MKWAYLIFIRLYPLIARLLAPINPKAALWVNGRKGLLQRIKADQINQTKPIIWLHAASLGEFEQGLPVAELLKQQYPSYALMVTFFSPSGYEVKKNHPIADYVYYLPMDSHSNAKAFIVVTKPVLAIFIKYEFWYFYLSELQKQSIPTLLVSGIFRSNQLFFKWYGQFYRQLLHQFNHVFVQDPNSASLIEPIIGKDPISISGDTRFDRVLEIAANPKRHEPIERFSANEIIVVAGSTWSEDDQVLQHYAKQAKGIKWIIAPHQISSERLAECLQRYPAALLLTDFEKASGIEQANTQTIVINNIGLLSSLYQYASIAFIGGGFTSEGIHNILEAAVYGKPVVFGPVYDKYLEAIEMVEIGAALSVETALDLETTFNELIEDSTKRIEISHLGANYVKEKSGASVKVLSFIQANRLLTN